MHAHVKYLSYVVRHKWFVLVAGLKTGAPLWRLIIHDWSKFTPREWFAYARFFYGRNTTKIVGATGPAGFTTADAVRARFDRAWLQHQHRNPHHWQHWVLREDNGGTRTLPMPEHFIREMVADWMGAGRAITGEWEARTWYASNREKMVLHRHTRARVEQLLEVAA